MRAVLAALLVAPTLACADAAAFRAKVVELYSFEPHTLDRPQIEAKSKQLDGFWDSVKGDPARTLPLLRAELRNPANSAFFYYDGAKLILAVSQDRADQQLALDSIPKADLRSVQHTDYLRTVHWFARRDFDTTSAALRILAYPEFKAFIVQHALALGQDYALIYMLFPMPEVNYLSRLTERLQAERDPVAQRSLLLALWYTVSAQGRAAISRFAEDASQTDAARTQARQLLERAAPLQSRFSLSSFGALKEERRKAMYRISDEALIEFDSLTGKLLAKQ